MLVCLITFKKKIFFTKEESARKMENHKTYHQYFIFTYKIQGICEKVKTNDREKIVRIGYDLSMSFKRHEVRIKKTEMKKGKFILVTSCLDDEKLSASDILGAYKGRNKKSEGCFKFIKDKTHNLNQIFF